MKIKKKKKLMILANQNYQNLKYLIIKKNQYDEIKNKLDKN